MSLLSRVAAAAENNGDVVLGHGLAVLLAIDAEFPVPADTIVINPTRDTATRNWTSLLRPRRRRSRRGCDVLEGVSGAIEPRGEDVVVCPCQIRAGKSRSDGDMTTACWDNEGRRQPAPLRVHSEPVTGTVRPGSGTAFGSLPRNVMVSTCSCGEGMGQSVIGRCSGMAPAAA